MSHGLIGVVYSCRPCPGMESDALASDNQPHVMAFRGFSLMALALAAAAALRRVWIGIAPGLLELVCESKTFRVLG